MRAAGPFDFDVVVPEAGTFKFAKRTMRDEIRIGNLTRELVGDAPQSGTGDVSAPIFYARAFATVTVLMVEAPGGWNPESLDPEADNSFIELEAVFLALRAKESSFRAKPAAPVEGSST